VGEKEKETTLCLSLLKGNDNHKLSHRQTWHRSSHPPSYTWECIVYESHYTLVPLTLIVSMFAELGRAISVRGKLPCVGHL
jgi:hypothetical protein